MRSFSHTLIAIALVAVVTLGYPVSAGAAEPDGSMFSFNGFGTLGIVHSSEHQADFIATDFEPNGAGYTRNWSASVDSLIGLQLSADLTPQLSAVLQLIAQQNYNDGYAPHVEWANIKYQFTPDFDVRVGRMVMPTFLVSDSRKVGYSNPWIRPPTEVYSLNPITNLDGLDASYRLHLGAVTNTLQVNYGRNLSYRFPGDGTFDSKFVWGIFNNTEYGSALLHLSYVDSTVTLNSAAALFDAFRQFGPQGEAIASHYEVVDKPVTLLTIAANYDPGQWFALAEWIRSRSDSFLGVTTSWYISGGYRLGKFTPYLTYAQVTERISAASGLSVSELPPNLAPTAALLDAGLSELLAARPVQYTSSLGVRWDFMRNLDLKVQLDRMNLGANALGTLVNPQPGFQPGSTVYLLSAAVDFVF